MDHYDEITDTLKEEFANKSARINELSTDMNTKLNDEVSPLISQVLSRADVNIDKVSGIIAQAQGELPAVERKLSETELVNISVSLSITPIFLTLSSLPLYAEPQLS